MLLKNKHKTAAIPHRIMNKTSIYLANQCKVDREDYLGYESFIQIDAEQSITVRASANINPMDGKVFEFVLAQWQASKKLQDSLEEIDVDVLEIVHALGWKNRTENRDKVIQHLKNMLNITIIYGWSEGEISFHLLETLKIIDCTKTIAIKVSETYADALESAKCRYVNVSDLMPLKSGYAVELSKLLQMKGAGLDRNQIPKLVKSIDHKDICNFLHLNFTCEKTAKDTVSKAFRELHLHLEYPKYSYNSRTKNWEKQDLLDTQLVVDDT